jgi:hypothetical protein
VAAEDASDPLNSNNRRVLDLIADPWMRMSPDRPSRSEAKRRLPARGARYWIGWLVRRIGLETSHSRNRPCSSAAPQVAAYIRGDGTYGLAIVSTPEEADGISSIESVAPFDDRHMAQREGFNRDERFTPTRTWP